MDAADNAQIEIEREQERSIAALKKPLVESTAECIECGAKIPPERQQAVNTNLCIGCAEVGEIRSRNYAARR
tara:strand:+ start:206 stop:421 length:216 start_codon:yes stop_codon:yes gene_type:complete